MCASGRVALTEKQNSVLSFKSLLSDHVVCLKEELKLMAISDITADSEDLSNK